MDLVGNVALGGDVNSKGHNLWQWTNSAAGSDCCIG
jgi:hypothetical protein